MTSSYNILTSISLLHDYYTDGRCNDFNVVPTEETMSALRGAGILLKTIGNNLLLISQLDADGAVNTKLATGQRLRFYLQLQNTNFNIFTNTGFEVNSVKYFTNLNATKIGSSRYLNTPMPAYSNAAAYKIGDMVGQGGKVFETIKNTNPGSHPPADTAYWQLRTGKQYVHQQDSIRLSDGLFETTTQSAKSFSISIFRLNTETLVYDVPVDKPFTLQYKAEVTKVSIVLHHLQPGKYRIIINAVSHFVYIDPAAFYNRCFGIIELWNVFDNNHDFGWLDADDKPKAIEHQIHFANRLTIWKYNIRNTGATAIEMTGVPNAFKPGPQPKQFVSAWPLPLKEQPVKTLNLMNGTTILNSKLPNPPPERISSYQDDLGNQFLCSEVFLNY